MNHKQLTIGKFDIAAHIFLYSGLAVGGLAIISSRYDSVKQFLVLDLIVVFYLVWGFAYHYLKRDGTTKLFLEYILISFIALAAGFLVLVS